MGKVDCTRKSLVAMNFDELTHLFFLLNLWLCLTSIVMVVASSVALSVSLASIGVGLVLPPLLFYFIYVEDRRSLSPEDRINQPYRTLLVQRYRKPLLLTEIGALGGYEGLLLYLVQSRPGVGATFFLLGQLPIAVLAAYSYLKRYPTFDSIAVGSTWAFVIVFTVLVSTGYSVSIELVLVFIAWFVIGFAGVESRNVHDIDGDVVTGRSTLSAYLGADKTRIMEWTLKTAGVLIFWHISGVDGAVIVVGYLLLLWTFRSLTRRIDRTVSPAVVADQPT